VVGGSVRKTFIGICVSIVALLFVFCSRSTGPKDTPHEIDLSEILDIQTQYSQQFFLLLEEMDTIKAKDSIINMLQTSIEFVKSVNSTRQGIAIEYINNACGGILIDPLDYHNITTNDIEKTGDSKITLEAYDNIPTRKKTIFLCPIYDEYKNVVDSLIDSVQDNIITAGYNHFTKRLNEACGLNELLMLNGYGIIHIYSYNFDWPENDEIQEVYLMSGDKVTNSISESYSEEIENKVLAIIYVPGYGNTIFMAPTFFSQRISLNDEKPLIYLGFGNSNKGNWNRIFHDNLYSGAVISFDGQVDVRNNFLWAEDLYEMMSDTNRFKQFTLQEWHDSIETSYQNQNVNPPEEITICYEGSEDFGLWKAFRISQIVPAIGHVGDTINIFGVGFGDYQGNSVVTIGDIPSDVVNWSDTLLSVIVPNNGNQNGISILVDNQTINYQNFEIVYDVYIDEIQPSRAPTGTPISIMGYGFGDEQGDGSVHIDGILSTVTQWTDTLIVVTVPDNISQNCIVVVYANGQESNHKVITVVELGINEVIPPKAHRGELILIKGYGFGDVRGNLEIGGKYAGVQIWTDTLLQVHLLFDVESGQVDLTTDGGENYLYEFHLITSSTFTSLTPNYGYYGDTITALGNNFGYTVGRIRFNDDLTPKGIIKYWSDNKVIFTVPETNLSGRIDVKIASFGVNSNSKVFNKLTFSSISSIEPTWAKYLDTFYIKGSGFGIQSDSSKVVFRFGYYYKAERNAEIVCWNDTSITALVPTGSMSGEVYMVCDGNSSNSMEMTVFDIRFLYPEASIPGKRIEIYGSDFGEDQLSNYVTINGIGAIANYWTDTLISVRIPEGMVSGDVIVHVNGEETLPAYLKIPRIYDINPKWCAPGSLVSVEGVDFGKSKFTIYFYGHKMGIVKYQSDSLYVVEVPEDALSGKLNLEVRPFFSIKTEPIEILNITSLQPLFGLPGDTVMIHGTGFLQYDESSHVTFNGLETDIISWLDTLITVIVPDSSGPGDIVVHANGLQSTGEMYTIVNLGDNFDYLHQTTFFEARFSGYMTYKHRREPIYRTEYSDISFNNDNKDYDAWAVNSFKFGKIGWYDHGNFCGCKGVISFDGDVIDSVFLSKSISIESGQPGHFTEDLEHYELNVYDIPFSGITTNGDTLKVIYELGGPDLQNHLSDIIFYNHYWGDGFNYRVWDYYTTDWENQEYPPRIIVTFKIPLK
jgi:IPT/TIG domain